MFYPVSHFANKHCQAFLSQIRYYFSNFHQLCFNWYIVRLIYYFYGKYSISCQRYSVGNYSKPLFHISAKKLEDPLINLEPMQVKPFALGVILNMLALLIIFAMNIVTPMFFTRQLGGFRIAILSDLVSGNFTFLYLFTFGRPNLR